MFAARPDVPLNRSFIASLALGIMFLLAAGSAKAQIPAIERNALLALYNATNGASWLNRTGWTGAAGTECTWFGVTCDAGQTTVIALALAQNNLVGTIPSEIGNLSGLTFLYLWENQLSGPIPSAIGSLSLLTELSLSRNQLTGSIPSTLGNLSSLKILYLWQNQLTGSIPQELGSLSELIELSLSQNQLSGSIPGTLGQLSALQELRLWENQLTGPIPPELGNLFSLRHLDLSINQLSGSIPSQLGNASFLRHLGLFRNGLTGPIPSSIGNLTQLERLYLSRNELSGAIPAELGNLSALRELYLSTNGLSGPIPAELGNLSLLTDLFLSRNALSGSIPVELGNLSNLTALGVSSNQLTGDLPSSLSNLTAISDLRLDYNGFGASNSAVEAWADSRNPGWDLTQTVPPANVNVPDVTFQSATLSWTPIQYTSDSGSYYVYVATSSGGPYTLSGATTLNKSATGSTVSGLAPRTTYYFVVVTTTLPHGSNSNQVTSEFSAEVSATTSGLNPTIVSVTPNSGSVAGGTFVTITGSRFVAGATVTFAGVPASGVTVTSATSITATTPANAAGPAHVTVTNPDLQSRTLPDGFTYTISTPAVTSVTPSTGPTSGGTAVTISGTGFQSGATVSFGGTPGTGVNVVNSTQISAITPSGSAGSVTVNVTNPDSGSGSLPGGFTYCAVASITGEPQDQSSANGVVTLTVAANGNAPLSYQWYRGSTGNTSNLISGATAATFQTPAFAVGEDSANYWVRVSNSCGQDDSRTVTVSRSCVGASITGEPQDASSSEGAANLSVSAGGTAPLSYQWYAGSSGNTGSPLPGATSSNFTTPAFAPGADSATYWVRVTNRCGSDDSRTVTVTRACATPSISQQPVGSQSADGRITLGVTATGTAPLSYQWYRGTSGNTAEPMAGATSASFQTPAFTGGQTSASYWVRVSNACGQINSATATITQSCVAPRITAEPRDAAAPGGIVTLSVTASGTAPLQYQWYRGVSGDLSNPIGGATASSFLTPAFQSGESTATYWVRVTNSCGQDDSRTVVVSLEDPCASIPLSGAGFTFRGEASGCAPDALNCVAGEQIRFTSGLLFDGPASCLDSVNARSTYQWSFGDGTGSSDRNPSKSFSGPGPYTVTLSVTQSSVQRQATRLIEFAPRVVVTEFPEAIVGSTSGGDTTLYTVRNIGGSQTTVNLTRQGTFFAQTPETFDLAPGASQRITITTLPISQGRHDGRSVVSGVGVPPGTSVGVIFLAENAPIGDVIGVAVTSRVDVSSPVGASSVDDTATFTNTGSATLTGVVSSDVSWLTPSPEVITIEPGREVDVPFTIDPTLRPDGGDAGTFNARLTLVYRLGTEQSGKSGGPGTPFAGTGSGSTSAVVSHTATAATPAGQVPPLVEGEVAIFLPGVAHVQGSVGTFISDVTLTSLLKSVKIEGLRLHFRPAGGTVFRSLPSFDLSAESSRTYADIARSIFENTTAVGSMQLRGNDARSVAVSASVFNSSNPAGTYGTTIPAFRSDRSAGANEKIFLTGLTSTETTHTNLYLQEATGLPASATIQFFNEQGVAIASREESLAGFGLLPLNSSVPAGGVSAVITTKGDSAGRVLAYATPVDKRSGDTWAVADWPRQYGYQATGPMLIPVAGALRGANDTYFRTDVAIMNSGESSGSGTMRFHSRTGSVSEQNIELQTSQSRIINDVLVSIFGISGDDAGYITFTPTSGNFAITSRTYTTVAGEPATFGSGVPTLALDSGIRLGGETRRMGGINDAAAATVSARRPNTFRTNLILVETAGEAVTVRATLRYISGNQRIAAQAIRSASFPLGARQFLQINQISYAILGDLRSPLGDLSNMQLEFEVVGGNGAAVVLTSTLDNGTGDSILRVD